MYVVEFREFFINMGRPVWGTASGPPHGGLEGPPLQSVVTMAEKKGVGHAYNVDFLNVVFAASSLFLFLSVIWMVWDDYDREWKNTQRNFALLETQVTQAQLQQAERGVDRNKLASLQAQQKAAQANVAANQHK